MHSAPSSTPKPTIATSGTARRERIDFTANGAPTGKYYYQTHVRVSDAAQIVVR